MNLVYIFLQNCPHGRPTFRHLLDLDLIKISDTSTGEDLAPHSTSPVDDLGPHLTEPHLTAP